MGAGVVRLREDSEAEKSRGVRCDTTSIGADSKALDFFFAFITPTCSGSGAGVVLLEAPWLDEAESVSSFMSACELGLAPPLLCGAAGFLNGSISRVSDVDAPVPYPVEPPTAADLDRGDEREERRSEVGEGEGWAMPAPCAGPSFDLV